MLASSGPPARPPELAASSAPLGQLLRSFRPLVSGPAGLQQTRPPAFGGVPGGVASGPQPHGLMHHQQHPQQQLPSQQLQQQRPPQPQQQPVAPTQQQNHHPGGGPPRPLQQNQQPMGSTGAAPMQRPQGFAGLQQPPASFRAAMPFTGQQPPGIGDDGPGPVSHAPLPRRFAPGPVPAVFIPGLDGDQLPGLGDEAPQVATQRPGPAPQQATAQRPHAALPQAALTAQQQVCNALCHDCHDCAATARWLTLKLHSPARQLSASMGGCVVVNPDPSDAPLIGHGVSLTTGVLCRSSNNVPRRGRNSSSRSNNSSSRPRGVPYPSSPCQCRRRCPARRVPHWDVRRRPAPQLSRPSSRSCPRGRLLPSSSSRRCSCCSNWCAA